MTALKIPFFPLGLRFPAGDVLNAVMVNCMVRFSAPLLQFSFSFLSLSLFSQPLYQWPMTNDQWPFSASVSFLSLFTNDQWPMTNDHSQPQSLFSASLPMTNDQCPMTILCLIFWSWKNKPPSSPRIGKWVKYQTPNHKSQIAKPISAKLSPAFLLYLFSQPLFSAFFTNDQWPMTFLNLVLFSFAEKRTKKGNG